MQNEQILKAQQNLVPVSRQAAAEGIVLLENKNQTLPLTEQDTVSLFGRCQIDTYRSGTGSGGAVNIPYAINAVEGLRLNGKIKLNEDLITTYVNWIAEHPFDNDGGGWAMEPWFQHEMPLTIDQVQHAATQSNKAIIFIGRTAGEDKDNAFAAGSYCLTDLEIDMIEKVNTHFDNVTIVFNTNNTMDMAWLTSIKGHQSIKAVLYSWAAGMEGGHGLADVLSGDVSPSGRLTDTVAYSLADYPSDANFGSKVCNQYVEDIYVGYRYFETFNPDAVQYDFGAGLSYSTFSRELKELVIVGEGKNTVLNFDITVTNTGDTYSSKEVVQLYVEAPQGKLGKAARVLAGFGKTTILGPNDSETIRITVPVNSLASYDDSGATGHKSAYVLEQGDYTFYLGASVKQAIQIDATWQPQELIIVEQLAEALAAIQKFDRLKPGALTAEGIYSKEYEAVPQRTISMQERIETNMPATYPITGDKGIKLIDVKQGNASMESFIAQLNQQQLATIVRGEGMCSPKVNPGTASAFGGVSDELFSFGIPVAAAADGPSGIRMDSGHLATQVPIGTLLGCTWNKPLNEQLFNLVGEEMQANKIDTLLGPGINIHRHPLNGRNFEYFSEDPLITGAMAAAQVKGLKNAGVTGTIKHFAANDQETARVDVDAAISERALREIQLRPFEMAVKEGEATTIMTSYNPINGHWAASNYDLNTTILRGEWGYSGIVMTDWWAKMNCPINAGKEANTYTSFMIRAQNDLYMVVENDTAESNGMGDNTLQAIEDGTLTIGELQRSAMNICRFILDTPVMKRPLKAYNPIKPIASKASSDRDTLHTVTNDINFNATTYVKTALKVEQDGIYQCHITTNYDRNSIAQSSCSLILNGEFAMSFTVHGTDGKTIDAEGLKLELQAGIYDLDINFVKPGMVIETMSFTKE